MPDGTEPTTFDRVVVTTHWLTELASVGGLRGQMTWPEGRPGHVRYSASTEPVDEVQGTSPGALVRKLLEVRMAEAFDKG
jgi:hypothetical protein